VPVRPRILVALALATLSPAAAPAANAAWTAPQTIVADTAASNVRAAGNRRGSEAFVWKVTSKRFVHTRSPAGFASDIRARVRLPSGHLGRVETISSTGGLVANPQIGVDERGNVTAVWTQAGRHLTIMAASRPHGRRFGKPFELGRSEHFNDARPALAVGRFGDAVIAWNQGRRVQVVRRRAPGSCTLRHARGCFTAPVSLPAGADQTVAIGPVGSAYVVWAAEGRSGDDVHTRLRMTVLRRDARRLGHEHAISRAADGDVSQPSIAVRRDGTAVVAWRSSLPGGGEQDDPAPILAAESTPDEVVSQPQVISHAPSELPQVRVNAQGEAILAWNQLHSTPENPDGPEIAVAVRPASAAAFGAPATITPANVAAGSSSLAVDAAGSAYLVHSAAAGTASSAGGPVGISHVRPAGGAFGPPIALPADFTGASVVSAGPKVTAVSGGSGGRTLLSDWTP
jgi:hypothetical protein